jgi:hypothetical protein
LAAGETRTLEKAGQLQFGISPLPATGSGGTLVTGGEIAPDGSEIVLRTYSSAFLWPRKGTVAESLAGAPCALPLANEKQGEAIGYAADGKAYFTTSEGKAADIQRYNRD